MLLMQAYTASGKTQDLTAADVQAAEEFSRVFESGAIHYGDTTGTVSYTHLHLLGAQPGRDHSFEHVLDHAMRLRNDTDVPAVAFNERADHTRRQIGLAGARRALHRESRAVEPTKGGNDRADASGIGICSGGLQRFF